MLNSIWFQIYELISNAIYLGDPSQSVYGEFIVEAISTIACVGLLIIPFVVIYWIIRGIFK